MHTGNFGLPAGQPRPALLLAGMYWASFFCQDNMHNFGGL
jgi:hypothetical protein